jgi:hypothetical protein
MAAKPGSLPRWADVGGAIVVPTSGKKDIGWEPEEKPPAEFLNWFQNLVYQWTDYVDDGELTGAFALASAISPAAITGSNNDYTPASFSTAQVIRQALSADATLTGLLAGVAGRLIVLVNLDASFVLTLSHADALSVAANRFTLPDSKNLRLVGVGSFAILQYDSTSARWRVVATNGRQEQRKFIHGAVGVPVGDESTAYAIQTTGIATTADRSYIYELGLPVGVRITGLILHYDGGGSAGDRIVALNRNAMPAGVPANVGATTGTDATGGFSLPLASDLPHVVADDFAYCALISVQDLDEVNAVEVVYD